MTMQGSTKKCEAIHMQATKNTQRLNLKKHHRYPQVGMQKRSPSRLVTMELFCKKKIN